MTLDYYRIFYYVAQYQSFSKAAEILGNNQPNLSRCMNLLESELGCKLLARTNRGVSLTPEGQRLFEHVAIANEQLMLGEQEILKDKSLESGLVTIGASAQARRPCAVSFKQTGAFRGIHMCPDFQPFHTAGHPCPVTRHRRFFRGDNPDRHQKTSSQNVAFILSRNPDRRFFLCRYCLPHAESARPVGGSFYLSRSRNRHERIVFPVFSKSSSCIFTGHGSIHDRSDSAHGCAQSRHRLLSGSTRHRTDCARGSASHPSGRADPGT